MVYNYLHSHMNKWNINASNLTKKQKQDIDQELILKGIDISQLVTGAKLYLLRNNLDQVPVCKACNKTLMFHSPSCSYRTYCSAKCSANCKSTIDKRRGTNLEKYGTINVLTKDRSARQKNAFKQTYNDFSRFATKVVPSFDVNTFEGKCNKTEYDWHCVRCNVPFKRLFVPYLQRWPKCPKCDGCFTDIEDKIKFFLQTTQFQTRFHYRKIIKHHEVDFFIPELQVAIETNGLFYHTERFFPDKNYHNNKTNLCLEKGVKLIQIFSDEINLNPKACFGRLKAILGLNKRLNGRQCYIEQISTSVCAKFLNKYHTQGADKSNIKYGLFYKNRLVCAMTFCKLRKVLGSSSQENSWELSRFVSMYGFNVRGGFQKLFKRFVSEHKPKLLISYCDKRWTPDPHKSVYATAGFQYVHTSRPNYWYVGKSPKRLHRANFQKHMLLAKHPQFNKNFTETQIMKELGYSRLWDCGHHKFQMTFC